jgi:phospholipase C
MNLDPTEVVQRVDAALARRAAQKRRGPGLPPPNPSKPVGEDCLPQIRHIVVLMMENHSYDNYLGTLGRGDGLPSDGSGAPTAANTSSDGEVVMAHRLGSTKQQVGVPTQAWDATHEQYGEGRNDGFVRSAERQNLQADPTVAMGYWTERDLPFYHSLASTFPLSDRWFSSCLGPTFPNRRFLVAGTAHGLTSDRIGRTFDSPANGTIFDQFAQHGISWANYHPKSHVKPVAERLTSVHGLRARRRFGGMVRSNQAESPNAAGGAKSYLQFTADAYPLGLLAYLGHVRSIDRFLADAANGTLPSVSIVDPDFHRSSEENPQDVHEGETFAAQIVNAVLHSRNWLDTLLIWTYDEHGGYYDHVPPPEAPVPDDCPPEGGGPWRYDRYGFRVPAVIVSPYARPDYVSHQVHDHTSILKLIETKWNLPPLTYRDAHADNLLDSLDLAASPSFAVPPSLLEPAVRPPSPETDLR